MNSLALQEDEVTALKAIYDESFHLDDGEPGGASFRLDICCSNEDARYNTQLKIWLPQDYPAQAPPVYELQGNWLLAEDEEVIDCNFKSIFRDGGGEVILYQWVEFLREYLDQKSQTNAEDVVKLETEDTVELEAEEDPSYSCSNPVHSTLPVATPSDTPSAVRDTIAVEMVHGEPLTDRKSTFQAHVAAVHSVEEVKQMMVDLKRNKKIAAATHNILAYRLVGVSGMWQQDCDDDGESSAGGRLLHLLQIMDARDVAVVVTRWYGGILLHSDRFKHINNVARILLQESGIGLTHKEEQPAKQKIKKKTKSKN